MNVGPQRRSGPCSHPASPSPVGNLPRPHTGGSTRPCSTGEEGTEGAAVTAVTMMTSALLQLTCQFQQALSDFHILQRHSEHHLCQKSPTPRKPRALLP